MIKYFIKKKLNNSLFKYMRIEGVLDTFYNMRRRNLTSRDYDYISFHIPPWSKLGNKTLTFNSRADLVVFRFYDAYLEIQSKFKKFGNSNGYYKISYNHIDPEALKMFYNAKDDETFKFAFYTVLSDLGF